MNNIRHPMPRPAAVRLRVLLPLVVAMFYAGRWLGMGLLYLLTLYLSRK